MIRDTMVFWIPNTGYKMKDAAEPGTIVVTIYDAHDRVTLNGTKDDLIDYLSDVLAAVCQYGENPEDGVTMRDVGRAASCVRKEDDNR